jgi:AraC-like DNA-binding protein
VLTQSEISVSKPVAHADSAARGEEPEVSGVLLRALADVAKRYDVSPAQLFQRDAERFATGEPMHLRVPLSEYRALVARAISLTGDGALGLSCGRSASDAAFDLFAPLVAHVPSLRHAIGEVMQFSALVLEGASIQISEGAGVARLSWRMPYTDETTDRFIAELAAAGVVRMLNGFGAKRGELRAVFFHHARPAQHRAYDEAFRGAQRFGAEQAGVEFAAGLLDRPHLHFNPSLQLLLHTEAEERLAQLSRPATLALRLRALLHGRPATRVLAMDAAARQLGISARSLRRYLADEGISYRALTQELQRERACSLLRNRGLTLQAVAHTLGFADVVAFHRAFKRWMQMTPGEYRSTSA